MLIFKGTRRQPRQGRRRSKGGEVGGGSARLPACRDSNRRILRVRYSSPESLNATIGQWLVEVARSSGVWGVYLKETEDRLDIARFISHMRGLQFHVTVEPAAEARASATEFKAEALALPCPACGELHVDEKHWSYTLHRTHLCSACGHKWQPFEHATVGVRAQEAA